MKNSSSEEWQCSLDLFSTPNGFEFRLRDGRTSLTGGADARAGQAKIAEMAVEAAGKLKTVVEVGK